MIERSMWNVQWKGGERFPIVWWLSAVHFDDVVAACCIF